MRQKRKQKINPVELQAGKSANKAKSEQETLEFIVPEPK